MEKTKMLKMLENNGFLVEEGLYYCAGSESIYREVLDSAAKEGEEKLPVLAKCMEEADYQRYQIEVHGIKNVAKTIGCVCLYEAALDQNDAAKEGKYEQVRKNHAAFMTVYEKEIALIRDAIAEPV